MPPEINFYNPRSLILFICILQGVIFAILLFVRSRKQKDSSDFWLGVLLLVMCTSLITHFIGFANVYDNNQSLTYFPFELIFAHAPVIYLYVLSLTDADRKIRKADLLLFLPALINWGFYFVLFLQTMEFKVWWGSSDYNSFVIVVLAVSLYFWNAIFLYKSFAHYSNYRGWINDNFSDTEPIKFGWLKNFLILFTFVFLLEALFGIIGFFFDLSYIQVFYLKLVLALSTYYLAIAGFLRSKRVRLDFRRRDSKQETKSQKQLSESVDQVRTLMNDEKPFLDPDITLRRFAQLIGINSSKLSETINKGFGMNFNDFINSHRIDRVKQLILENPDSTLLEIGFESGFNSKATFNRSFKKFTGQSPGAYAKEKKSG